MWILNSIGLALLLVFWFGEVGGSGSQAGNFVTSLLFPISYFQFLISEYNLLKINCTDIKHSISWYFSFPGLQNKRLQIWGLKGTEFILSQVWRLEIQNQVVSRSMISWKSLREDLSLPLPGFWWLHAVPSIPCLWKYHSTLSPSSHGILPVCLYFLFS